eukprot:8420505-Alexandrium_andersonii.AAC.1
MCLSACPAREAVLDSVPFHGSCVRRTSRSSGLSTCVSCTDKPALTNAARAALGRAGLSVQLTQELKPLEQL